jgi:3-hydroxyacyl-CoA dehydrogenase
MEAIRATYASSLLKGKLTAEQAAERIDRIRPAANLRAIASADLVIEAIFERLDVKLSVFRELDGIMRNGAILATNTSTLNVDDIAAVTRRPEDVVGTHFFSPAHIMRLLEVVRGRKTSADVLASVLSLSRKLNKIGVVVGVCEGFVGNRMIHPYFRESEFLLAEGATPAQVDGALQEFGLPMGPFTMSDLAGNDVRADVERDRALRRPVDERSSGILAKLAAAGRLGQKSGRGWYRYEPGSRIPIADPAIESLFEEEAMRLGIKRRVIEAEEIVKRCLYPLVNEGAAILQEGIALRGSDIDVIYVNGYGFPAYRGGPMYWADNVGLSEIAADIERFNRTLGNHWKLAPLLASAAREGTRLSDLSNVRQTG